MIKILIGIYLVLGLVYLILVIANVFEDIIDICKQATKCWQKICLFIGFNIGLIIIFILSIVLGPILLTIYIILVIVDQTIGIY